MVADDGHGDRLQRRDLQLPRAAGRARGAGHASAPSRTPRSCSRLYRAVGHRRARTAARACSRSCIHDARRAAAAPRPRPAGQEAAVLDASATASSLFASEIKALLRGTRAPAGARPPGAPRLPDAALRPRRRGRVVGGRAQARARAPAELRPRDRRGRRSSAGGALTSSRGRSAEPRLRRASSSELLARRGREAAAWRPTCRSACCSAAGIDSSAVSAAAVELGHRDFHTFSVGFAEGGECSELGYARQVAEHIGSRAPRGA